MELNLLEICYKIITGIKYQQKATIETIILINNKFNFYKNIT